MTETINNYDLAMWHLEQLQSATTADTVMGHAAAAQARATLALVDALRELPSK